MRIYQDLKTNMLMYNTQNCIKIDLVSFQVISHNWACRTEIVEIFHIQFSLNNAKTPNKVEKFLDTFLSKDNKIDFINDNSMHNLQFWACRISNLEKKLSTKKMRKFQDFETNTWTYNNQICMKIDLVSFQVISCNWARRTEIVKVDFSNKYFIYNFLQQLHYIE